MSFVDAERACEQNSAQIASPEQLWAAFHSGLDECSAGWLSDQTVRLAVLPPTLSCVCVMTFHVKAKLHEFSKNEA